MYDILNRSFRCLENKKLLQVSRNTLWHSTALEDWEPEKTNDLVPLPVIAYNEENVQDKILLLWELRFDKFVTRVNLWFHQIILRLQTNNALK